MNPRPIKEYKSVSMFLIKNFPASAAKLKVFGIQKKTEFYGTLIFFFLKITKKYKKKQIYTKNFPKKRRTVNFLYIIENVF